MLFAGILGIAPVAPDTATGFRPGALLPGGLVIVPEPTEPRPADYRQMARDQAVIARAAYESALAKSFSIGEQVSRSGSTAISSAAFDEARAVVMNQLLPAAAAAEDAAATATLDPVVGRAAYEQAKAQADTALQVKNRVDELYAVAKTDADVAVAVAKLRTNAATAAITAGESVLAAQVAAQAAQEDALIALSFRAETAATEAGEAFVAAEKAAVESINAANKTTTTLYTKVASIQVASETAVALANTAVAQATKAKSSAAIAAEEAGKGPPPGDLEKWYMKPWVWAAIGGSTLALGGGAYLVFRIARE